MAAPPRADQPSLRLQLRVGAFILVALAVLAGLIYALGQPAGLFERHYRLTAGFSQVGGLVEGATVRLAGVPVGRVTAIRLPEAGGTQVQVELTLARRVQDRIRADSVARIETLGLLGDKLVEISLGSPRTGVLPDGARLETEEPLDTARLTKQGVDLLGNLAAVSADLKDALGRVTESTIGPDLVETVRTLRALAGDIREGQGLLHRLVYDRQLGSAVGDAALAVRRLGDAFARLDRLLADPRTGGLAEAAGQTLAEARGALARANALLRRVEDGPGLLHALIYDESRAVRALDGVLARVERLVDGVERGEGAVGILLRDEAAARAARRLVAAADALGEAALQVREGDGLLAALVAEPGGRALVADLRQTARQFRELTERVARGEGVLGGLTRPGSELAGAQLAEGLAGLGQLALGLADDGELQAAVRDLRVAMADLRAIAARVQAGEGTLGGLIADPTVYENLAAFLEGAQRSLLLRALIRSAIGEGETAPAGGSEAGR